MEINPSDRQQYLHEVQEGKQIFQESFKEMQKKGETDPQKVELSKAAKDSLHAIHDAANALMNKELQKQTKQLQKDFDTYLENPTPTNANQITEDLNNL